RWRNRSTHWQQHIHTPHRSQQYQSCHRSWRDIHALNRHRLHPQRPNAVSERAQYNPHAHLRRQRPPRRPQNRRRRRHGARRRLHHLLSLTNSDSATRRSRTDVHAQSAVGVHHRGPDALPRRRDHRVWHACVAAGVRDGGRGGYEHRGSGWVYHEWTGWAEFGDVDDADDADGGGECSDGERDWCGGFLGSCGAALAVGVVFGTERRVAGRERRSQDL
ncbi:hypothetical protein LTR39_002374, partial [Cryomyces antarcticus]